MSLGGYMLVYCMCMVCCVCELVGACALACAASSW